MPRKARLVIPGTAHHITQRGNNRQEIFVSDEDKHFYLITLRNQADRKGLKIIAYCLMNNHVHLIVVPSNEDSLNITIGRTHWLYTQHINRSYDRVGHLWQGRFYSCPLDDAHSFAATVYVERNPVRGKLVAKAWDYHWSSASAHVSGADNTGLLDLSYWRRWTGNGDWREILAQPEDNNFVEKFRRTTLNGSPLGDQLFTNKLKGSSE